MDAFFRNPRTRFCKTPIPPYTPCGYCFRRWAVCWDHLMPYSHGGLTVESNLYPTCKRCNSMLSHKVFGSIEEKREYARQVLIRSGQWRGPSEMSDLPSAVCEDSSPGLLQPEVQMGRVARKKNRIPSKVCLNCNAVVQTVSYCSATCRRVASERRKRERGSA